MISSRRPEFNKSSQERPFCWFPLMEEMISLSKASYLFGVSNFINSYARDS